MNPKTIFMFSGQGSQYFQMARELFDHDATFHESLVRLDGIVQELSGNSVIKELYLAGHGKTAPFGRTILTHPAIFMVEYSLALALLRAGIAPDMTLGVSMGSFAAAACAGCIDPDEALTAVVRQASALEAHCEPGGMIAILAAASLYEGFLAEHSELVSVNFDSHFAIAAPALQLLVIEEWLKKRGLTYQRLPVSFAFHSRWIDAAQAPFRSAIQSIRHAAAKLPLICCASGTILESLPGDYFWQVARKPIRFRETVADLESGEYCYRYIDAGPAGTLATFLKYVLPPASRSSVHTILTPFGDALKNFAKLLNLHRPAPV